MVPMMGFEAGMMAPGGFGSAWLWLGRKNPKTAVDFTVEVSQCQA
jgi:hypothetical protein